MIRQLGIAILGGTLDTAGRLAQRAEAAGFDSVWTADFYERSAVITLAVMAQATERISVGSAIAYAVGRSPLIIASEARSLDELSGGRLILGLGTGTVTMQRDWHSVDFSHSATRMEELIPLIRRYWTMDHSGIHHEGRFYQVKLEPTVAVRPPSRTDIPLYMAALNPRSLQAVGAVADGLIGHPLFSRGYVEDHVRPAIAKGAQRTGADPAAVKLAGMVLCSVSADAERARREVKAQIAFYSVVRTYKIIAEHLGYEAEAAAMRAAWQRRDVDAMIDSVPDRLLDLMGVAGTPDEVADQLDERFGDVYDHTLLYPPTFDVDAARTEENLDAILEVFAPATATTPSPATDGVSS